MSQQEPELPGLEAPETGTPSPEPEPEAEAHPRDPETGRFVAQNPKAQQLLDKYGGDVEKALAAAIDAQDVIGRQSSELGELRQLREYYDQQQRVPADQLLSYAAEDPRQGTALALQQYGPGSMPYEQALRQWAQEDPIEASRFDTQVQLYQYQQQIQPQLQQTTLNNAMSQLTSKYSDVAEYGDAILREAEASPLVQALRQQGQEVSYGVLETLYLAAKGRQGVAQTQVQTQDANLAREQKLRAGLATPTAGRPEEPGPPNPDDEFREAYLEAAREMGMIPRE